MTKAHGGPPTPGGDIQRRWLGTGSGGNIKIYWAR